MKNLALLIVLILLISAMPVYSQDETSGAYVYSETMQFMPPGANTFYLSFTDEIRDDADFHSPSTPTRLTIPVGMSGWYAYSCNVRLIGMGGIYRLVSIRLNGGRSLAIVTSLPPGESGYVTLIASGLYYLSEGDYMECMVGATQGVPLTTAPRRDLENFSLVRY